MQRIARFFMARSQALSCAILDRTATAASRARFLLVRLLLLPVLAFLPARLAFSAARWRGRRRFRRIGPEVKDRMRRDLRLVFGPLEEARIDALLEESVEIIINRSPKTFVVEGGRLKGMLFDVMEYDIDAKGGITAERVKGEEFLPADDVLLAIGQENAFPWIEGDLGIEFDKWHVPKVDPVTFQSTRPGVFFGGDSAFGPRNIIWAVEHGHQAAISIHKHCQGEAITQRLLPGVNLQSRKMGMHEWSYANDYTPVERRLMPHVSLKERFKKLNIEVELGFSAEQTAEEVQRCLNCDVQTVFEAKLCIECDACIDICPVDCLTITHNGEEAELRTRLKAPARNLTQALYVSKPLPQTARVMVKDEDLCVHCGLCAERCPTAAWDMQKSLVHWPHALDEAEAAQAKQPKIA